MMYFFHILGLCVIEAVTLTYGLVTHRIRWQLLWQQLFRFGVESIPIIVMSAVFTGSILTFQAYFSLAQFGSVEILGQLVGMSVHRELGPVMCALLLAGRAASSCTAELMLMRETDQMNALKVLGADLRQWIIYPRILGYWLANILLSFIFNAVALLTSAVLAVTKFSLEWDTYWSQMSQGVYFSPDITMWLSKSFIFGWVVAITMIHQGMHVRPSNEGMASAVTRTVVISSTLILFMDMVVTSFSF